MPKDQPFEPDGLSTETVFEGRVWDVVRDTFDYANQSLVRDYIKHPGAVAILAVNEANQVLMIRQYRHPVRKYLWEIPAGLLDVKGESHLDAAKRELLEETNHVAHKWSLLQTFHASPGGNSEQIDIFLAEDLAIGARDFELEGEEVDMEVAWIDFDEALASVMNSEIQSPIAVIAILRLAATRR